MWSTSAFLQGLNHVSQTPDALQFLRRKEAAQCPLRGKHHIKTLHVISFTTFYWGLSRSYANEALYIIFLNQAQQLVQLSSCKPCSNSKPMTCSGKTPNSWDYYPKNHDKQVNLHQRASMQVPGTEGKMRTHQSLPGRVWNLHVTTQGEGSTRLHANTHSLTRTVGNKSLWESICCQALG